MNPEAIEAAAKTFAGYTPEAEADDLEREVNAACRTTAKRVLEAAAPYLIREARAAELEAAADDITESAQIIAVRSHDTGVDNGQTLHAMTTDSEWLRARAAAIRDGVQ